RRRTLRRAAAAARDRARARRTSRCPAPRRALARPCPNSRRAAVRDAGRDPSARRLDLARRAARADDDCLRRSHARDRKRATAPDVGSGRCERHRPADGGLPLVNWGQAIADAISLGALYGLVAVGIGLVFGVMRLINFAYGELITAGAYVLAYTSGWPPMLAIVACFAAVIALALAQERIAFRPLRRSGAAPATMLVATFAVSFLLQAIYLLAFGTRGQIVGTLGRLNSAFTVGGVDVRWIVVVTTVSGVALLAATAALLNRTNMGLHLRAAAYDFRTARILGVRANRVIGLSFVVAGFLAAAVSV